MKPDKILQTDMLDILFENRNKAYGAYVLRKDYNGRLFKATGIMVGMVFLFIAFNYWKSDSPTPSILSAINIPPDVIIDKLEIIDPPTVDPPKPPASIQYTTPVFSDNVAATIPEITELDNDVQIGTQNIDGPPASESPLSPPPSESTGSIIEPKAPEEKEPTVYFSPQVMPEYPGGETAMRRFLQRNLRFDFEGQEPGSRVMIKCRFVVDKEGKVTAIEIIQSGGQPEYDKEVTRVVTKMPSWKPGFQNGKSVAVYFTLPVVVEVPEQ